MKTRITATKINNSRLSTYIQNQEEFHEVKIMLKTMQSTTNRLSGTDMLIASASK